MKNIIVTHKDDVDGIVSGALLRRFYGSGAELIFCSYPKQEEVFRKLAAAVNAQIIIADICAKDFPADEDEKTPLEQLAFRADALRWYDHHEGTNDFRPLFNRYGHTIITGGGVKICAAKLIQDRLFGSDKYADFLARIAQAHDYPPQNGTAGIVDKIAADLQKIISHYGYNQDEEALADLVCLMARGAGWLAEDGLSAKFKKIIADADAQLVEVKEQAYREAVKNRVVIEVNGKTIVIVCADPILPEKDAIIRLLGQFPEADGVLGYFLPPLSHVLFFRGLKSDFNAQKFCEFMGGGGRDGNGGFTPAVRYEREDFRSLVAMLAGKLADFI